MAEVRIERSVEELADMGVMVTFAEELCQTKANITQLSVDYTVTGEGLKSAEVSKMSEFQVTARLYNGASTNQSQVVECHLKTLACDSITKCKVNTIRRGEYRVQYTPAIRGRHELTVTVDGQKVAGCPFSVFVSINPTQLGKPERVLPGLNYPSGVAITSAGEIVVSEGNGGVVTLSREGKRLRSIKRSDHHLQWPRGVAVDGEDNIYFIDRTVNKIYKCDKLMQTVLARDAGSAGHLGHRAVGVVDSEIMVCEDKNKGVIKVYNNNLEYIKEIFPKDRNCGHSKALTANEQGNVVVADYSNGCVLVMSGSGDVLRSFGCDGEGVGKLNGPAGVCVSGQYVYVCNYSSNNIAVFTTEGEYVTSFGQDGDEEGEFKYPIAVCVDRDGFLYVCDEFNKRIQIF